MTMTLSPTLARRLAITRQRLAGPRPTAGPAGIMELMRDLGCIQIDPIRAVERTQLLVLWSRLGHYDPVHLDTLLWDERKLFEYWAHAASIVLTEDYPLHQIRMRRFAHDNSAWSRRMQTWVADNESLRRHILTRLHEAGPLASNQIEDLSAIAWESTGWTDGRNVSRMIDFLWEQGEVLVAERRGLHKKWALAEQCLPEWTGRQLLSEREVVRRAAQKSLRALGVATLKQINNHFMRGYYPDLKRALAELVAEGQLIPVSIAEPDAAWPGEWYIHAADLPRLEQLSAGDWQPRTSLLSPFDNLICDRERTQLLWDFHFRIEIYVPQAKRQYGYYVLPILHEDRLIGRIDPKMDRKAGILRINAVYAEPDAPQDAAVGQAIAATITDLAHFLGAREIAYHRESIPPAWQAALR